MSRAWTRDGKVTHMNAPSRAWARRSNHQRLAMVTDWVNWRAWTRRHVPEHAAATINGWRWLLTRWMDAPERNAPSRAGARRSNHQRLAMVTDWVNWRAWTRRHVPEHAAATTNGWGWLLTRWMDAPERNAPSRAGARRSSHRCLQAMVADFEWCTCLCMAWSSHHLIDVSYWLGLKIQNKKIDYFTGSNPVR